MKRTLAVVGLVGLVVSAAAAQQELSLPAGTAVWLRLDRRVSTVTNKVGDRFTARVSRDTVVNGKTVIPTGAAVEGTVTRISEPRRIAGKATLELRPELVTMPNGARYALHAVVVDTSNHGDVTVDEEGRIKGNGMDGEDKRNIAIGTGAGLVVGTLIGGGKGAVIGGAIGAGATLTRWLAGRRFADLPQGTEVVLELTRPMTMSADD